MKPRLLVAQYAPRLLRKAQYVGLMPNPLKGPSVRRLQQEPENGAYIRHVHGQYQPPRPLIAPQLRPDTPAGDTYAAYINAKGVAYDKKWSFGVFDVPSVRLLPKIGVHSAKAGNFTEVYCGAEALKNPKYEISRLVLPALPLEGQHDSGIFLAPAWHHNFYHWMIDILPRLDLVARYLTEGLPIVVPSNLKEFARSTLRSSLCTIGMEQAEIVQLPKGAHHFERLVMPTNLSRSLDVSPRQRAFLRSVFLPTGADITTRKRIYISRKDAAIRRIANEDEIEKILLAHGFEIVKMAGLPIARQVATFASAEVVVSHHGAAMTNLAFCAPGTVAIEIFQEGHFSPSFTRLAQLGKLQYGFGVGTPVGGDTYLDPAQLIRLFKDIGL